MFKERNRCKVHMRKFVKKGNQICVIMWEMTERKITGEIDNV